MAENAIPALLPEANRPLADILSDGFSIAQTQSPRGRLKYRCGVLRRMTGSNLRTMIIVPVVLAN
jgi:hypothetical protein